MTGIQLDTIVCMDALAYLKTLPDECVNCVVTSPPYWNLRDYGVAGQMGSEATPQEFVANLVTLFREVKRVLRSDGTCWVNLGDSYANDTKWGGQTGGKHALGLHGGTAIGRNRTNTGLPSKSLIGIPWRVAFGLQDDGWILRSDIIWAKPNPMPESVTDRPTKAHEYLFLLTKSGDYWYDVEAIREPAVSEKGNRRAFRGGGTYTNNNGFSNSSYKQNEVAGNCTNDTGVRNKRDVWTVASEPFAEAHFATFPQKLVEPCVLAGCPAGGVVLDPFMGSGTTALVARRLRRHYVGCDLNPEYVAMAERRLAEPYTPDMFVTASRQAEATGD
jgi:DNA modification methylase